ncbi:unnamed protein product [Ceratitis capitata]|uniref:(Mediterranean fruit fly) hypothetical protein n=1 Tax=Ceratitis capitata TaxID=7213 RepID=A0A811U1F3_CERCA|nr:unnamed protein product [Ceratitis capitata]
MNKNLPLIGGSYKYPPSYYDARETKEPLGGDNNPSWEDEQGPEVEQKRFEIALELVGKEFTDNVLDMAGSG